MKDDWGSHSLDDRCHTNERIYALELAARREQGNTLFCSDISLFRSRTPNRTLFSRTGISGNHFQNNVSG